jgi:hypothetical protein
MLILLFLALGLGAVAGGALVSSLWSSLPRSNADFGWVDV